MGILEAVARKPRLAERVRMEWLGSIRDRSALITFRSSKAEAESTRKLLEELQSVGLPVLGEDFALEEKVKYLLYVRKVVFEAYDAMEDGLNGLQQELCLTEGAHA